MNVRTALLMGGVFQYNERLDQFYQVLRVSHANGFRILQLSHACCRKRSSGILTARSSTGLKFDKIQLGLPGAMVVILQPIKEPLELIKATQTSSKYFVLNCFLSGPLNQLNAILSLLQPLNCYRTLSAIVSAIGRPYLALSRIHTQAGILNRLVLNRMEGSNVL